jgi:enoyl-CoA hydratase/carnithine racemase
MPYEFLTLHLEERVGWLSYNHAPMNAFNLGMLRELDRGLEELLGDPGIRVVVIASALERFFSVGADLRVFQTMGPEEMRLWAATSHATVLRMRRARKPLLAAIHGTAVGGGLEFVLNCDIRFAAADARLGQPEINIAFIPPAGATQALPRLIGRPRALRFLYEGTLVSAGEALAMGLVDFVVPPGQLRKEVQAYAAALGRKPQEAIAAIRRCITEGMAAPYEDGLRLEREAAAHLAGTPDFAEGIRAFLEKRPPKWV